MNDILQYRGYCADIHFSIEDGIYYGKLMNVDDRIQFEANCVKSIKRVFIEAVEDYIRACKELYKTTQENVSGFNHRLATQYQQLF